VQSTHFPRLALLLLLAALAASCAVTPPERAAELPASAESARALEASGEFSAAADAYLAAADQAVPEVRARLRLAAARALLRAAEVDRAERVAQDTTAPADAPDLALERDLVLAEIALVRSLPQQALRRLPPTVTDSLPIELRRQHLELRARALLQAGDTLASARERLLLDALTEDGAEATANQLALLGALRALGPALPDPDTVESDLAGWIALARLAAGPPRHAVALEGEIAEWRARYPDLPVRPELLERLLAERQLVPAPTSIAVLLPSSGPFANAATAVRDGFLAALYAESAGVTDPDREQLTVRFYDSSGTDTLALYSQAVTDGAEVVVGPLRKEAVTTLASAADLPVPVLALNQLEPGAAAAGPGTFYQYALAPEGEAVEVADRAWYDGHRQVVMLVPATDFGQRIAGAFRARWEALGGSVLEVRGYDPAENDFSQPITDLLGLNASEARYRALRGLLRQPLEFEPRRRRDADAVFIAALPRQARLLKPQLAFYRAADLPVYATSHVYAPETGAEANRDLDGLRFCDMPWTLGAADPTLAGGLPAASGTLARLFALGADAFHLLPYLPRLQNDPGARLDAQSGLLSLAPDGRVQRQLLCAEFAAGVPRLLGYTPRLAVVEPAAGIPRP
jgi:outer membrane PBP1 activator LpoA protein